METISNMEREEIKNIQNAFNAIKARGKEFLAQRSEKLKKINSETDEEMQKILNNYWKNK